MDVHLLVYDLSRGLAQQMSMQLLGFELKAVYHTSIQLNGLEYVYDGNIVSITPGSSHLGRPMEIIYLGKTELPMDVIEEYLDSLREIYTVEAYDLWRHNCNNFSNDFATFLLGKGIPDHIVNMPQAVLNSPFGRMLLPMLNQQVDANRRGGGIWGIQENANGVNGSVKPKAQLHHQEAKVKDATSLAELESLLTSARNSCAVIFFTSQTCAPCRTLYPLYNELAAEVGQRGVLIKVDTSRALDVASRYSVSATPTFVTFLRGQQENRWSGADPAALRGNVQLLVQMAWPPHPHEALNLPTFSSSHAKPVIFSKIPPLDKLLAKMGSADNAAVAGVRRFIEARAADGPADASLPDMAGFSAFVRESMEKLPTEVLFTVVDLLRCALVDPRFSGYLAEEKDHQTILSVLNHVNGLTECPYALRLVTLQTMCNFFSSPLWFDQLLAQERLRAAVIQLISTSFLDDSNSAVRNATAWLLVNIALANGERRRNGPGDALPESDQVELAASVLEAISAERSDAEALDAMLMALGWLAYRLPLDGELADLLRTMDAEGTVRAKKDLCPKLSVEVGEELLGKGLRRT